jgi:hypothetical protein
MSMAAQARLTLAMDVKHPRVVVPFCHRLAAVLCLVALTQSSWVECAGWQASAEARRSCCEQSANCPSHKGDQDSPQRVTQAVADSCCAASEPDKSGPSTTPFAISITLAVLQPALPAFAPLPLETLFDTRESVGLRASPVPKHLLLSVFLV